MFRSSAAAIAALALSGAAFAQIDVSSQIRPAPPGVFAGTYYVATGKFIPAQPGEEGIGAGDEIYNNTAPSGFFFDGGSGVGMLDEGIIPDNSLVVGGQPEYSLNRLLIGYCSDAAGTVDVEIGLYSAYLPCADFVGAGAADFTVLATGLPGGDGFGGLVCSFVAIDLTGSGACIDGTDGTSGMDFGYSYRIFGGGGPLLSSDPINCPAGDGTFYQNPVVGCDGAGTGSGFGDLDLFFLDGFGCAFFGGYPANPFASLFLAVGADLGDQCGTGCSSNDDCACATPIFDGATPYSTLGATTDGPADANCQFDGQTYHDIWFVYEATCTGELEVSTCNNTDYDSDIVVYDGTDCNNLTTLGCVDDTAGCAGFTSIVTVPVVAGNSYLIRVGGWNDGDMGNGTLNVTCTPAPCTSNDDCDCAIPIFDGMTPYSTLGATTDGPADANCQFDGQTYHDIWFTYEATCTGNLEVSTCNNTDYDSDIVVYDGTDCDNLNTLGCVDDTPGCAGFTSIVNVPVVAGNSYLVRVGGWNDGDMGNGTLSLTCTGGASNDNCADRTAISGIGVFDFDNTAATTDGLPDPLCYKFGTSQIDNDVWYTWTAPCNGDYVVETCNLTLVDTKIAIYDGADCATSSVLDCNDDTCGLSSQVTGNGLIGGESYLIRIGTFPGGAGGTGQFSIAGPDVGGANYCVGGLNGDGQNGSISISGSTSVAANDLVLVASDLTDSSFAGLFVMGDSQASVPFSNGTLCIDLAGSFFRLNPIINGGGDVISRTVDNTAAPANVITPGSTWYFQYWYRDTPIFGTNLTDGICVCFAP